VPAKKVSPSDALNCAETLLEFLEQERDSNFSDILTLCKLRTSIKLKRSMYGGINRPFSGRLRLSVIFYYLAKGNQSLAKTIEVLLHFKITGILNNVFRPQKTLKKTRIKLHNTLAGLPVLLYGSDVKARHASRMSAAEMKYLRRTAGYNWDRLQNKYTNCKGVKNNSNFGQITGIQEKLDTTFKQNAS
jgi:hypothetical protein